MFLAEEASYAKALKQEYVAVFEEWKGQCGWSYGREVGEELEDVGRGECSSWRGITAGSSSFILKVIGSHKQEVTRSY